MKLMPISEVRRKLSRLVAEIETRDQGIIITRNGRPAAVLLSADQFEGRRETAAILADDELMQKFAEGSARRSAPSHGADRYSA
jgi:antitoxin YefM